MTGRTRRERNQRPGAELRATRPMTQGKIERYHRSMKNILLLDNYYSPDDLKAEIEAFVEYYNYQRYHESLDNVTPADVYTGRAERILKERDRIKERTMKQRKREYRNAIAQRQTMSQILTARVRIV